MTPRTILQLGAFPFPLHQGSQVYVGGMARAQARRGHRVLLACYGHGIGAWPEGVEPVRAPAVPALTATASGPHVGKPVLDLLLAARVARVLRRERVDVVHAHNVEAPFVGALAAALAGTHVPLVYNLHTSLAEELPTYWRRGAIGRIAPDIGRAVDGLLARRASACVAISDGAARRLRAWGARRVFLAPPGVDVAEVEGGDATRARRRWALGARPWVVYTGNADAYQDLDVLMDAIACTPGVDLLVVTGDPDRVTALTAARRLGPDRVRVVGSTSFDDTRDALAVAAACVVPRAVCAGFPIKLLNGLALGVPTVCAAGSAQPIPGVVVVPDRDAAALGRALQALVEAPVERERLGRAAADAIRADWTWEAAAARLDPVYDAVV
ncbi:MAG: glycosyltransferase family 4 protein [Alphaproteobacteria bacterium]|nr:glycosyltransferase family 4 protein [Alphaproteobacteria bacterium]